MATWLSDFESHGLSEDVLSTLRANGIATLADLADAGLEGRLRDLFDDEDLLAIVRASWSWIRANYKPKG